MSEDILGPWIENVSFGDVQSGNHHDAGDNSMLIQIMDMKYNHPKPVHKFKEIHQFSFNDVESDNDKLYGPGINDEQAKSIASLLQKAIDSHMNVVVNCAAGICRSGAVVEVGSMLGFRPVDKLRIPNTLVKTKLMREFGWTYDSKGE